MLQLFQETMPDAGDPTCALDISIDIQSLIHLKTL